MADKWIQGSVKRPGALTAKAKAAGESPMEFAREHVHSKGLTGQEARWAVNVHGGAHSALKKRYPGK